jgi:hypothetical protein
VKKYEKGHTGSRVEAASYVAKSHLHGPPGMVDYLVNKYCYGEGLEIGPGKWIEPLREDNELININSWREAHEKDEAALQLSIQDMSSS